MALSKLSCKKCGTCCRNLGKLRIHKSEAGPLRHFRGVGVNLREVPVEGVYVFEGGKCPFVSRTGCTIHTEKPLICKAAPFVVGTHKQTGEPTIVLWAGKCPEMQEHVNANWERAPKKKVPTVVKGRFADVETAEMSVTREEIEQNPYLRGCLDSAIEYIAKAHGRAFRERPSYNIVIAFSPDKKGS